MSAARKRRTALAMRDLTVPTGERAVFNLSHDDALRYADIAARLQIPVGTVKSRMESAVRRLRAALTTSEENP